MVYTYGGIRGQELAKKLSGWDAFPEMSIVANLKKYAGNEILDILEAFKSQWELESTGMN
ncbi:MAG: hypothetical protein FWF59_01520 [Turicibacter sp.]|nr:hypothetical protein [Turicibacter sp.]